MLSYALVAWSHSVWLLYSHVFQFACIYVYIHFVACVNLGGLGLQASFDEFTASSTDLEKELEDELQIVGQKCAAGGAAIELIIYCVVQSAETIAELTANNKLLARSGGNSDVAALGKEISELQEQLSVSSERNQQIEANKRNIEVELDELQTQQRVSRATEADLQHKLDCAEEDKVRQHISPTLCFRCINIICSGVSTE